MTYLTDLTPVDESQGLTNDPDWQNTPVTIDGHEYAYGIQTTGASLETTCQATIAYNLGRRYSRFIAVAGLDDNTVQTTPETLEISTNNGGSHSYLLTLGKPTGISLDVRGVLRLNFSLDYTDCQDITADLGDPRLEP